MQIILPEFYRTPIKFIKFLRNKDIIHFEKLIIYIGVKALYKLHSLTQTRGWSQYLKFNKQANI